MTKIFSKIFISTATTFCFLLTLNVFSPIVIGQGAPQGTLNGHRVLLFGDSQVAGAFGRGMMYELTVQGATYCAVVGESGWGVPSWWNNRYRLRRLIREHRPTLLLVELGGNDWSRVNHPNYSNQVSQLWRFLLDAMEEVHRSQDIAWRIIWISPATVVGPSVDIQDERDRVADTIRQIVGIRNYAESRDITGYFGRTADGLHFTAAGGQGWAKQILPRIEDCLER